MRKRKEAKLEGDAEPAMCVACQNGQHEDCDESACYECEVCGHHAEDYHVPI